MPARFLEGLNIAVMVCAGIVFIIRTNDILKEIKAAVTEMREAIRILDKRVTVIETVCGLNHPESAKELLTIQS